MKVYRIRAIIERDMRKFFRSPALMMTSMVFPLMQLIVLGYAFGGKIKNVRLALVDEDRSSESRLVRERLNAIQDGPKTFNVSEYNSLPDAMTDLRAGFVKAVLDIQRAADHPEPGHENVEPARGGQRGHHQADGDGGREGRLQRPVEQALLTALGGRPVRAEAFGFRRGGPAGRRPGFRELRRVLVCQA